MNYLIPRVVCSLIEANIPIRYDLAAALLEMNEQKYVGR